jgi:hypothetical protein
MYILSFELDRQINIYMHETCTSTWPAKEGFTFKVSYKHDSFMFLIGTLLVRCLSFGSIT